MLSPCDLRPTRLPDEPIRVYISVIKGDYI